MNANVHPNLSVGWWGVNMEHDGIVIGTSPLNVFYMCFAGNVSSNSCSSFVGKLLLVDFVLVGDLFSI